VSVLKRPSARRQGVLELFDESECRGQGLELGVVEVRREDPAVAGPRL